MGSKSDWPTMKHAANILKSLKVKFEKNCISSPNSKRMFEYAINAKKNNIGVIIAGAGGSAHLPGMIASLTEVPVLGVPVESKKLKGLDSLLSIVQMPRGIPVGTVAIGEGGAMNAALLAASILGISNSNISNQLKQYRIRQTKSVKLKTLDMSNHKVLGIIGGGQLGSMLCQAATKINIKTKIYLMIKMHLHKIILMNLYTEHIMMMIKSLSLQIRLML